MIMTWTRNIVAFTSAFSASVLGVSALVPRLEHNYLLQRTVQCGVNAPPGQEMCPLNRCCSQWGYCGMDDAHCGTGCQNNCHRKQPVLTCNPSNDTNRRAIAYYESWASTRPCDAFQPSDIDPTPWTHVNFAFALLDDSGKIVPSTEHDPDLYKQTTALKARDPDLRVWIAVGGYALGGKPFSEMASSQTSRRRFIHSARKYMNEYGFDGVDIDWEYPAAEERGGKKTDTANFVELVKEMRAAFGPAIGISITIPAGAYYMKGFDLQSMQPYLDMINIMSYDMRGPWEKPMLAQPGTNLTEINEGLQLLWNVDIPSEKVNLGLAYYGHSYTLHSSACTNPGCPAAGRGKAGPCSKAKGTLNIGEIQHVLANEQVQPKLIPEAAVKYFSWGDRQWVSYDDNETLQLKEAFARERCLGGSFVWAIDMEKPSKELVP